MRILQVAALTLLVGCLLGLRVHPSRAEEKPGPPSTEKVKRVQWPGVISIFHGHNWGTDEKFVVALKEANFGGAGATEGQIDVCRKHGLKAFVFAWPHESIAIAPKYKNDPDVLAYYMSDRQQPSRWGIFAQLEKDMYRGDPVHPAIFTTYALLGGIDQFVPAVQPRALEFYHYHWDPRRAPHMRYAILDQFRQESLKAGGLPVIEIVLVMHDDVRKTRQSMYTSLAYGTRGFRWWGGSLFFDLGKRDARGIPQRTALGDDVVKLNSAVKAYNPIFAETRCVDVYHTTPLPQGTKAVPTDSWIKLFGSDVCVGVFQDAARNDYLFLANRDAFKPHEATLRLSGVTAVRKMDKSTGIWQPVPVEADVGAVTVKVALEDGSGEMLSVSRTPVVGKSNQSQHRVLKPLP